MPKRLTLRSLTDDEAATVHRLAHARTIPQRQWQRARIVWLAHTGGDVATIATANASAESSQATLVTATGTISVIRSI